MQETNVIMLCLMLLVAKNCICCYVSLQKCAAFDHNGELLHLCYMFTYCSYGYKLTSCVELVH